MENLNPGASVEEAASNILGLLDSDEEPPEQTEGDPADDDSGEDQPEDESEEDEGSEESGEVEDADPDEEDESDSPDEDQEADAHLAKREKELTADYTKKTQALSDERRAFEAEREQERATLREARSQYAQGLERIQAALAQMKPPEPDWEALKRDNPTEYAVKKLEWQELQQAEAAVAAERQQVESQQAEEQRKALEAYTAEQARLLHESVPEWQDESIAKAEKQALVDYAHGLGYTQEEVSQVVDHRVFLMLRKAMKYDELTTKGAETIREKKQAAKVLKPGQPDRAPKSGKRKLAREANARLRQLGTPEAAAAAILATNPDL